MARPKGFMIRRKCNDGKTRELGVMGYDCKHHRWISYPYIASQCDAYDDGKRHECAAMNCPWRCKHFEMKEERKADVR